MIILTINGIPKAQKRPKFTTVNGHARAYDPSAKDKQDVLAQIRAEAPEKPCTNALCMSLTFYIPRPKSHYGTGKNRGVLKKSVPEYVITRPDIDNYIKFILDAMNGLYFKDDSQICMISAVKKYAEKPLTYIVFRELISQGWV